jgi:hypothetical protein
MSDTHSTAPAPTDKPAKPSKPYLEFPASGHRSHATRWMLHTESVCFPGRKNTTRDLPKPAPSG